MIFMYKFVSKICVSKEEREIIKEGEIYKLEKRKLESERKGEREKWN